MNRMQKSSRGKKSSRTQSVISSSNQSSFINAGTRNGSKTVPIKGTIHRAKPHTRTRSTDVDSVSIDQFGSDTPDREYRIVKKGTTTNNNTTPTSSRSQNSRHSSLSSNTARHSASHKSPPPKTVTPPSEGSSTMSSSSLSDPSSSFSSSSKRTIRGESGRSHQNNTRMTNVITGRRNKEILQGTREEEEDIMTGRDGDQLSSRGSSYDEDSYEDAPRSSSSRSNNDDVGVLCPNDLGHFAAVSREKDRVMQRKIYSKGTGFPYSVDLANSVKRVLKEKIFPKIKLLSDLEAHYMAPDFVGAPVDQSRNICDVLIRELELPDDLQDKISFWITYRSLVKNQLVKFRSNCVEELKKQYFKVKEMLESEQEEQENGNYFRGCKELMALLEDAGNDLDCDIIALRENDESVKEAFFFFAREFLPCVVKRLVFRQFKLVNLLSEFVTISDEAFTLLLLENNVARWNAMFIAGKNKADDTMPPQKFQSVNEQVRNSNGEQLSTSCVKDGYSLKAASRYMEYFDYVEEARKDIHRDSVEMELLKRMEELGGGKSRYGKGKRKRDGELSYIREDGTPMQIRYEAL